MQPTEGFNRLDVGLPGGNNREGREPYAFDRFKEGGDAGFLEI